jgi:iron complex outermembrane recepter protein
MRLDTVAACPVPHRTRHRIFDQWGILNIIHAAIRIFASTLPCLVSTEALAQTVSGTGQAGTIVVSARQDAPNITLQSRVASLGALGPVEIRDTPSAISVVPSSLIEQQQLRSVQDALRYLPWVQGDGARPQSRGFQGSVVQNSRIDGFNIVSTTDYAAQQFDSVQVLNGLAGAIYGPANPAGMFEYTLKRPTEQTSAQARVGYGSGNLWLEHLDLSGKLAGGAVGLRANLLNEAGEGYLDRSHVSRQLASLAADVHLAPGTTLELNGSYYFYLTRGVMPSFSTAANVAFPADIDPRESRFAQPYGGQRNHTYTASAKLKQALGHDWTFTIGLLDQIADRETSQVTDTITNAAGAYTATIQTSTASRFSILSNQAYLNGSVDTGPLHHQIAVGTNGFIWTNSNPYGGQTFTLGSATLGSPLAFSRPALPDYTNRYRSSRAWQQVLVVSDRIGWGDHWSLVLTGSQSWLGSVNSNAAGATTSRSSNTGFSPSVSLVYKPNQPLSFYATYANAIQQGDTAPAGSVNQNDILAPYRSTQWEGGAKLGLKAVDLTLAVFQISRPFAFINAQNNRFEQDGTQRNRGVEASVNGRLLPGLSVLSGVAYLDPRLLNTGSASTSDKRIVGLSRWVLSSLVTWDIPHVKGLQMTAFARHASDRPTDNLNRFYASAYTTLDLGLQKSANIKEHVVTFRLDVNNVTDTHYLTNIVPGGLNGYSGAGNASAQLGQPRTVQASVAVRL